VRAAAKKRKRERGEREEREREREGVERDDPPKTNNPTLLYSHYHVSLG
jgi:hypothetical protein